MGGRTERTGQPDRAVPLKPEGENLRPAMVRQGQRVGLGPGGALCLGAEHADEEGPAGACAGGVKGRGGRAVADGRKGHKKFPDWGN